jgi:hypothetical protein
MNMNPTLELIAQLTTTRRHEFSERDVLAEHIEIIKSVVTKTANSSNRQLYSVIVLGRDRVQAAGLAGSNALVFCVDNSRLQRMAARLGKTCDSTHFLQFVTAAVDVAMLAQSTIIAARSLGLSTWITNDVCLESKADLAVLLKPARRPRLSAPGGLPGLCQRRFQGTQGKAPRGCRVP